jgi:tetratricopeptide (TPR) repeat protein
MTRKVCRGLALSLLVSSLGAVACGGGSTPPANEPDPSLEPTPSASQRPDPNAVQPASSSKVSEGMDAIQKQDFEAAKTALTQARKESPNDPQAAYYLGVALHSLGDTAGARKEYSDALKLDPKLTEASVNLSQLELEAKELPQALATVDAGLKSAPKQPDLLLNRALILEASGKPEEALKAYGEAAAARPDDAELHLAYADLLRQAGKSEEAVKELKKVQTDDPTLLAATARQFGLNKAFSECVASLDKAIKAKSTPDLLVRRGVCRHEMKDDAGAAADYEAALKADPNFAPAHYYLGMHLRATDKKRAMAELEKAAALAKNEGVGPAAKRELEELKKKK